MSRRAGVEEVAVTAAVVWSRIARVLVVVGTWSFFFFFFGRPQSVRVKGSVQPYGGTSTGETTGNRCL